MGKAAAYGGVVVDDKGRLLLREARNHFDGYIWTFAKGRPNPGETPEQAAIREVLEETGVAAEIVRKEPLSEPTPGAFEGRTTKNVYFLMSPTGVMQPFCGDETQSVMWTEPDEARELLGQSTNDAGRKRDLAVLEAALQALAD